MPVVTGDCVSLKPHRRVLSDAEVFLHGRLERVAIHPVVGLCATNTLFKGHVGLPQLVRNRHKHPSTTLAQESQYEGTKHAALSHARFRSGCQVEAMHKKSFIPFQKNKTIQEP